MVGQSRLQGGPGEGEAGLEVAEIHRPGPPGQAEGGSQSPVLITAYRLASALSRLRETLNCSTYK